MLHGGEAEAAHHIGEAEGLHPWPPGVVGVARIHTGVDAPGFAVGVASAVEVSTLKAAHIHIHMIGDDRAA